MNKLETTKRATPGQFAVCRNLTGGDIVGAALLYRIVGIWTHREKTGTKFLQRIGQEWVAMSRDEWGVSAGLSLDGVSGASPVQQCREAIGLAMTIESHTARLFGRGARPSGVLTSPGKVSPEAMRRMATSWKANHGSGNSGNTVFLEEGTKWEALTLTSIEADTAATFLAIALDAVAIADGTVTRRAKSFD